MPFELNYKAIYELRPLQAAIYVAERKVRAAQDEVHLAEKQFRTACTQQAPEGSTMVFSHVACGAEGISCHVYAKPSPHSVGHCIFCGLDDEDLPF